MKQILQSLKTGEIELAELPVPAVKAGHLLIKTSRSLISLGTERMLLNFGKAGWIDKARQQPDKVRQVFQKMRTDGLIPTVNAVFKKLDQPLPLGYSNAGVVIEVGAGVTGFKPGDRVISNGNHAEVVCVPQHLCARIPDGVDDTTASFTVVAAIALQGIRLANPTLGENVAVIGLGLIGLLSCQILQANGCRVIGFDFDAKKVALAKSYGVEAFDVSSGVDPVGLAMNFSRGNGVDSVIITAATSSNDPIQQAPQMCRKRGKVVLVGVVGLNLSRDDFYKKEISFQVSCSYGPGRYENEYEGRSMDYPIGFVRWTVQRNFEAVLDLMATKKIVTDNLVSHEIDFAQAHEAYKMVSEASDVLGLVLKYSGNTDLQKRSVFLCDIQKAPVDLTGKKAVLGVIGAGNFAGGTLIPAFAATDAQLKIIASSSGVSGSVVGGKNGFAISTTDTNRIFSDPEVNTVVITTQHDSHAKFVLAAINSGKNVFVEKPLCMNFSELEKIRFAYDSANKTRNLKLMVGFNRRFSPLIKACKKTLEQTNAPCSIIYTVNAGNIPSEHWTQDFSSGGGRIIGEVCHFIDLIRFLTGSEIDAVQTSIMHDPAARNRMPDTCSITVSFKNGSIGTVHYFANGNKDFPKERIEIFVNGGIIQVDNFKSINSFGVPGLKKQTLWTQDKGHSNCAAEFVKAIAEGMPTPIPFNEIYEVTSATLLAAGRKPEQKISG
ncbi:MAG: bi-domain-containing oxidoreductase [Candidatus Rifleibacteriota bacterium]